MKKNQQMQECWEKDRKRCIRLNQKKQRKKQNGSEKKLKFHKEEKEELEFRKQDWLRYTWQNS
jgi:hypothetical protein